MTFHYYLIPITCRCGPLLSVNVDNNVAFIVSSEIGGIKPKVIHILYGDELEAYLKEINVMVSYETFLNYLHWKSWFTVHTDASDKNMGAVINQNVKPIYFSWGDLSRHKLTTLLQRMNLSRYCNEYISSKG